MSLLSRLAVQAARAYGILSSRSNNVSADYLVVAGGGGGAWQGGGGGAGGYQTSTFTLSTLNTYSIAVGAGGNGGTDSSVNGSQGSNSSVSGTGLSTITSTGGGSGGGEANAGGTGGSGGGGGAQGGSGAGGSATSGQGFAGGSGSNPNAGGGGGASEAGNTDGQRHGGDGLASSISGSSVTYAGGGSGGSNNGTSIAGGDGGGGAGTGNTTTGSSGTVNTGGGGGGGGSTVGVGNGLGGAGGSGIVIISYTSATPKFVGGTITTSGGKQIHTFTSSGTLSPITPITASYLVVAGGGGGGSGSGGGGAGAGGLLTSSTTLYSGATYIVTVGAGGNGATGGSTGTATSGSNSVLSGTGLTTVTSTGGGRGGNEGNNGSGGPATGGSGGGASYGYSGAAGTSGQGNAGGNGASGAPSSYSGGGGGGASAVGANASGGTGGNGGAGTSSSISGSSVTYAGGGGGGSQDGVSAGTPGTGGAGGGGNGGSLGGPNGGTGTANTGGGGGGGRESGAGGNGGSGIVIISYAGSQAFNGGLVTTSGGNTIHTFTSTGALTPLTNNLNNSLRFRKSNSAYLSRTPTVTGNRKTFTWSGWVKRGEISVSGTNDYALMCVRTTSSTYTLFSLRSANAGTAPYAIIFEDSASTAVLATSNKFRDTAAWYHFVLAVDTTQATAANRVKIYVNGNQVTSFDTYNTYPTLNSDMMYNTTNAHNIGRDPYDTAVQFDGYMTDINFIDGQALEPYYFGNNDANGVWKPIQYKGTYGTNGFYLTFGNTTSTTTLGYDSSPNGNNWTCNNISLTAGVTYDAMTDVPTNTSATVANYALLNFLQIGAYVTASNGNLTLTGNTSTDSALATATISFASGKYYYEYTQGTAASETCGFALVPVTGSLLDAETFAGNNAFGARAAGTTYGTAKIASSLTSWASGDVVGIAIDADNGAAYWSKNGVWQTSGVPTSGASKTGAVAGWTPTSSSIVTPFFGAYNNGFININFGQRPFSYTPPTGYVALNTYNL